MIDPQKCKSIQQRMFLARLAFKNAVLYKIMMKWGLLHNRIQDKLSTLKIILQEIKF